MAQSFQSLEAPMRQRRDYYREVNHVVVEGLITQTKWSQILITFSAKDANLASFPHTDAIVLTVHINRWDISRILIGFGDKRIEHVEVITLPVYFGTQKKNPHRIYNL
jgi:hypothetical protein